MGAFMATLFSLGVTAIRIVVGGAAFERLGASWLMIVGIYYAGLSLGGCAYGALLPLRRFALGAILLGFLLMFPMYAAFAVILGLSFQRVPSVQVALVIGVILSAFVGGAVGLSVWSEDRAKSGNKGASGRAPGVDEP